MQQLGIRLHDLGKNTAEVLASEAKSLDFDGVQLVINKAIVDQNGLSIPLNDNTYESIATPFLKNNLEVFMLGAYFNPVHSDKAKVQAGIDNFKNCLKYATKFGCKYVGTETGSYNDDSWTYNPKNRQEIAFEEDLKVFKELAAYAESVDAYVLIEPAYGHCIHDVDRLIKLLDAIDSKNVFVIIDLFNLLYIGNYQYYKEILSDAIDKLGDKIKIFHLKNFIVKDNELVQTGLSNGYMDFDYLLSKYRSVEAAILIFEGVKRVDLLSSLEIFKK